MKKVSAKTYGISFAVIVSIMLFISCGSRMVQPSPDHLSEESGQGPAQGYGADAVSSATDPAAGESSAQGWGADAVSSATAPAAASAMKGLAPRDGKGMVCEGYTAYCCGHGSDPVVLIDMDGNVVHEYKMGAHPHIVLPGGALIGSSKARLGKDPLVVERGVDYVEAIELGQETWDGELEWSFSNWDDGGTGMMMSRQDHDYQREGNPVGSYAPGQEFVKQGNTLILAHKNRIVPGISDKMLQDDVIYEIDWNGKLVGFPWYMGDHFDEFGLDQAAKEALYQNPYYKDSTGFGDYLHTDSMFLLGENHWYDETGDERFNPENIIVSARNACFVAIIDRKTGNLVWKVGPDFSEGTPEQKLGQFVGQHHAQMIPKGLPGEGNILLFDNGGSYGYGGGSDGLSRYTRDYSRVIEFNPVTLDIVWEYGAESGEQHFFADNACSVQRLPNGNTLIAERDNHRIIEVTPEKEIVWEYFYGGGSSLRIYRAFRVPPEWIPGNPAGYTEWSNLYE